MKEVAQDRLIMIAASQAGHRLFKNVRGTFEVRPREWKAFGLQAPGASDLIGWRMTTITLEMVGQTLPVFCAIEDKIKSRPTPEQLAFIHAVQAAGGRACVAYSVEEALDCLAGP